jgi:hypothetical protein
MIIRAALRMKLEVLSHLDSVVLIGDLAASKEGG